MPINVSRFDAVGLYDRFDIHQTFLPGINIIFGENGVGKTTLLHIIANALSGDYERFQYLAFKSITLSLSDGRVIQIDSKKQGESNVIEVKLDEKQIYKSKFTKESENFGNSAQLVDFMSDFNKSFVDDVFSEKLKAIVMNEFLKEKSNKAQKDIEPFASVAYFPAFRTMIEAWAATITNREEEGPRRVPQGAWRKYATERARSWFGKFIPTITFPSLVEIEEHLAREIENARMSIWKTDQELIVRAFLNVFASLSADRSVSFTAGEVLNDIQNLFLQLSSSPLKSESKLSYDSLQTQLNKLDIGEGTDDTAVRVLNVYKEVLEQSLEVQRKSFESLQRYQSSVNEFLDSKTLGFQTDLPRYRRQSIGIFYNDGTYNPGLRSLSSGERQIITLLYASTHMSQQDIVLIDEPEISLHVDWQRKLIQKMAEQIGDRQIIACTHAPAIGADHLDKMRELPLSFTNKGGNLIKTSNEGVPF